MLPSSLETNQTAKMLAILEQWDQVTGSHTDNTEKYLLLLLLKCGMDTAVFYLFCQKQYKTLFCMGSLSIVLVDLVMVFFMAKVWFLGAERSFVLSCYFLANASGTYAMLPVPLISLGFADYALEGTYFNSQRTFCKIFRNMVLTLLAWMVAAMCSSQTVNAEPMELHNENGTEALVCEVEEATLINYFNVVLFIALLCTIPPFWSRIPRWVREANRLSNAREEHARKMSDLFTSSPCMETEDSEENCLDETIGERPPLWFSLTLAFGIFWMPYLTVSVACLVFGVPAYISVNLLWLECINSLLIGLVFWINSKTQGPYCDLPENVYAWNVYWHLSKGTQEKQLPVTVFNPSKGKRTTYFYV